MPPTPLKYTLGALFAGGVCTFFSAGLATAIQTKGFGSGDTAGWVQAIGATLGIGIAIWVPIKQKADADAAAEAAHREAAHRLCLVFRNELGLIAATFTRPNMTDLLRDAPNEIFNDIIPTPTYRFPVFNALIGQLTQIDDEIVRLAIMDAYDAIDSTIEIGAINNRLLNEYLALKREINVSGSSKLDEELKLRERNLRIVGPTLRQKAQSSVIKTKDAVEHLDRVINLHVRN